MRILYLGDIMGEPGLKLIEKQLPKLKQELQTDAVIAQVENLTDGKGVALADFWRLRKAGVDFGTGGNWSLHLPEATQALSDPNQPIVRPANYPDGTSGLGYKYLHTPKGDILVVSLLGQIVGRDAAKPMDNPLHIIDAIMEQEKDVPKLTTIVNFHGDYSSEKYVIGRYLDGRSQEKGGPVGLVVGDHWHVPTNDAMVLPGGTAHITDVGMCGTLDSCLGVAFDVIIDRWYSGKPSRNMLATEGRLQINAVLADIDDTSGKAIAIEHIRRIYR